RKDNSAQHNRKIDICVHVNETSPQLDRVILASRTGSINHTSYAGLLRRPIRFSIETKTTGHDWSNAVYQIASWLIAQWDALDDLVELSVGQRIPPGSSPAAAFGLEFLPSVIIQGHEWWFVAVSRTSSNKNVFWTKVYIGSTTSTQGVYGITAVIQLLGHWVTTDYWPWFKSAILNQA
ncbi:hypothetical protein GQ607_011741, partial [Colletotrichum asianum]